MNIDGHARRVLAAKVIAAVSTYGFVLLLARVSSEQDFGLVAFFLSLAVVGSVVSASGQQMVLLRFLPGLENSPVQANGLVGHTYRRSITGGVVVYALGYVFWLVAYLAGSTNGISPLAAALGLALIPLLNWCDLQSAQARGLGRFVLSVVPKEILWRTLVGTVLLATAVTYPSRVTSVEVVLLLLCASLIIVTLVQRGFLPQSPRVRSNEESQNADFFRSATPFWISSVSNIFLANADVIVVGMVIGPAQAGIYFVANRLAQLLAHFVTSYNVVLGPRLSAAWQNGRRADCARYIQNATLKSTISTALAGLVLYLISGPVLALFGAGFLQSKTPLLILILATVLNAASGPADIALNMCGQERPAMKISVVALLFSAIALLVGAIGGGATGVALAVLAATAFRKFRYWRAARNHLGLGSDIVSAIWHARPQSPVAT